MPAARAFLSLVRASAPFSPHRRRGGASLRFSRASRGRQEAPQAERGAHTRALSLLLCRCLPPVEHSPAQHCTSGTSSSSSSSTVFSASQPARRLSLHAPRLKQQHVAGSRVCILHAAILRSFDPPEACMSALPFQQMAKHTHIHTYTHTIRVLALPPWVRLCTPDKLRRENQSLSRPSQRLSLCVLSSSSSLGRLQDFLHCTTPAARSVAAPLLSATNACWA